MTVALIEEQLLKLAKEKSLFEKMNGHRRHNYRRDVNELLDEIKHLKLDQHINALTLRKSVDEELLTQLSKLEERARKLFIPYSAEVARKLAASTAPGFIKRHSHSQGRWHKQDD